MTDDALTRQLARIDAKLDRIIEQQGSLEKTQAASMQAARDMDRRITQLETDTRTAFRLAIGGLLTWSMTVLIYLVTGGKA